MELFDNLNHLSLADLQKYTQSYLEIEKIVEKHKVERVEELMKEETTSAEELINEVDQEQEKKYAFDKNDYKVEVNEDTIKSQEVKTK
jgi:hypothetical protein